MSNIFKKNSRFGALAEETSTIKEIKKNNKKKDTINKINEDMFKIEVNSFKSDNNSFRKSLDNRPKTNYNNGYQRNSLTNRESNEVIEMRALEEKLKKEHEEKIEQERVAKALSIDNFPTLGKKDSKNKDETNNNSFLTKLKISIKNDKIEAKLKHVVKEKPKSGWVVISRDLLTGRNKIEYSEFMTPIKPEKTENEIAYDILYALCDLHERRTEEFIDLYGYDTWEKTFKTLNWEEEERYFDILDEEYEAQMTEDEEYEDKDEYNDNDKYWERY